MRPVTLTSARLLLRTVGPADTEAVHTACQDPGIQRWISVPSPYLRSHAETFTRQMVPDGWRDASTLTFGAFLRDGTEEGGALTSMLGLMARAPGTRELGFWTAGEHRRQGYLTEAALTAVRWAMLSTGCDRVEWRAEVGNHASRAAALRIGFRLEGTLRSAMVQGDTRRDCWVGSLLPADLGLPSATAYLPARPA